MSVTSDDTGSKPKKHSNAKNEENAKEDSKVEKEEMSWKRSKYLISRETFLCASDICICLADFLTDICLKIWTDTNCRFSNLTIADWLKISVANGVIPNFEFLVCSNSSWMSSCVIIYIILNTIC